MAITVLTKGIAAGNSATGTVTIDTTGANLIVVAISSYAGDSGTSLTDSKSNSGWQTLTSYGTGTIKTHFRYVLNPSSVGASHSFTYAGSLVFTSIAAYAISGVSAFDARIGKAQATSTSRSTDLITPSSNGSLLIAASAWVGSSTESGAGTYTDLQQVAWVDSVSMGLATSQYIQPTAASIEETFSGSSVERVTSQCCFTAAATGNRRRRALLI